MEIFPQILIKATAGIAEEYFRLAISGGNPVYRERVYCYELYHQMRLHWPDRDKMPFTLSGEVDKKGHPIISALDMGLPIPDFLVHQPGDMARNHVVIEVKPQSADRDGIRKDFTTLSNFRSKAGYDKAIFLLYGMSVPDRLIAAVMEVGQDFGETGIEFWIHPRPHRSAELMKVFK